MRENYCFLHRCDGIVRLGYKGGEARFNIVKGAGQEIVVLNQKTTHPIKYGDEFKITITFKGKTQMGLIEPIEKIYQLSCVYKDDNKKTGIYVVCFTDYGNENE